MPESKLIEIALLRPDGDNPRFEYSIDEPQEAFREIAKQQKAKLVNLAKNIALSGWDEGAQLYIEADEDNPGEYVVREGNRRLCALRAIESPEMFRGSLTTAQLKDLSSLPNKAEWKGIPEEVRCLVYSSEESELLRNRIRARHRGEFNGSGVVPWGPAENERFEGGENQPAREILQFLRENGRLGYDRVRYLTTLSRMLLGSDLSGRMGIKLVKKEVFATHDLRQVADVLEFIVKQLASREVRVKDVFEAKDRTDFAFGRAGANGAKGITNEIAPTDEYRLDSLVRLKGAKVPSEPLPPRLPVPIPPEPSPSREQEPVPPTDTNKKEFTPDSERTEEQANEPSAEPPTSPFPTPGSLSELPKEFERPGGSGDTKAPSSEEPSDADQPLSEPEPSPSASETTPTPGTPGGGTMQQGPREKPRSKTVVPGSFRPRTPTPRIRAILRELRGLEAEEYGNACGVLLRVLLELSVDEYRVRVMGVPDPTKDKPLEQKMVAVAEDLEGAQRITIMQSRAVVAVARENSIKGVYTLHQLIHNQYYPFEPGPLFRMWDTLGFFLEAIYKRCGEFGPSS